MVKKHKHKKDQENKLEYVPPQVMRLEDVHTGQGDCSSGTGIIGECGPGYTPTDSCWGPGNDANITCSQGIGVLGGGCMEPGGEHIGGCLEPGGAHIGG